MSLFLFLRVSGVDCGFCLWLFLGFSVYLFTNLSKSPGCFSIIPIVNLANIGHFWKNQHMSKDTGNFQLKRCDVTPKMLLNPLAEFQIAFALFHLVRNDLSLTN